MLYLINKWKPAFAPKKCSLEPHVALFSIVHYSPTPAVLNKIMLHKLNPKASLGHYIIQSSRNDIQITRVKKDKQCITRKRWAFKV